MKIYLDPHIEGCNVWFSDGNAQSLKGDIKDICERVKNFVIVTEYDYKNRPIQYQKVAVYLDILGIGSSYEAILNEIGVEFERCTYEKLI